MDNNNNNLTLAEPINNNDIVIAEPIDYNINGFDEYEVEEKYCGPVSCFIGSLLLILFWPVAICVPLCPCDKRKKRVLIVNS